MQNVEEGEISESGQNRNSSADGDRKQIKSVRPESLELLKEPLKVPRGQSDKPKIPPKDSERPPSNQSANWRGPTPRSSGIVPPRPSRSMSRDEPNYREPYPSGPPYGDYRDSRDPAYPARYNEDNELRDRDRRRGSYDYYAPYDEPGYDNVPPDYRAAPASKAGPIPISRGYTTGSVDLYDYDNYGPGGSGYNDRNYDYPLDYPSHSYSRDVYDGPRYERSSSALPGAYDYPPSERNISRNASLSRDPVTSSGGRDFSPERRDLPPRDVPPRDLPPRDLPPRDLPPRDLPPRDLPARDLPARDIPPRDLPPRDPTYPRESGIPSLRPPRDSALPSASSVPPSAGSSRDLGAPVREKSPSISSTGGSSLPKPSKIPPPKLSSDRASSDRPPVSDRPPANNPPLQLSSRAPINPPISSPPGPILMKRSISNDEYIPPQKKPFVRPPPSSKPLSALPSPVPTPQVTPKSLVPPPPVPPNVARPKTSGIPTTSTSHGSLKEGITRTSNPSIAPDRSPAGSSVTSTTTPTTNASAPPSAAPVAAKDEKPQQPKPLLKLGSDEITKPKEIVVPSVTKPSSTLPVGTSGLASSSTTASNNGPTEITRPKLFDRKDSFSASNTNIPRPSLPLSKPATLTIPTPTNKDNANLLSSHHHAHHSVPGETSIVYTLPTSQLDVKSESSTNNYSGMFKNPAFFPSAPTPTAGNESHGPAGMFDNLIQRSLSAMSSDDTNVQPTQPQRRPRAAWGKGLIVQPPPVKVEEPPTPAPPSTNNDDLSNKTEEEKKLDEKKDISVKEEEQHVSGTTTTSSDVPPALPLVPTTSMDVDDDEEGQINKSKRPLKRSRSQLQDGDAPSSPIPTSPKGIKEPLSTVKEETSSTAGPTDETSEPNRKKRGRPFNTKRQVSSDDESTSNQQQPVIPEGLRSPKASVVKEEDHAVGSPQPSQDSRPTTTTKKDKERERELLQREKDRERDRERERAREREREKERERVERERDRERERERENKEKGEKQEREEAPSRPTASNNNDRRAAAAAGSIEAGRGAAGAGRGRGRGGGRWANRHLQQQQQQDRSSEQDDATRANKNNKGENSDDYPNAPNRAARDSSTTSSSAALVTQQQQKKLSQKEKKQMLLERIQLGNVFTKEADLLRTYNTMAYILELQKTQLDPTNHKTIQQFTNICNIFQDIKTVHAATKLPLLKSSEICYAIDLIESNIEMFYTMLGNQRAKQYMTEMNIRELDKLTVGTSTLTPKGKMIASMKAKENQEKKTAAADETTTKSPSKGASLFQKMLQRNQQHQQLQSTSTSKPSGSVSLLTRSILQLKKKPTNSSQQSLLDPAMKEKLQEIQRNNHMRIVEAHLFTTVINQSTPMATGHPISLRNKFHKKGTAATTTGTAENSNEEEEKKKETTTTEGGDVKDDSTTSSNAAAAATKETVQQKPSSSASSVVSTNASAATAGGRDNNNNTAGTAGEDRNAAAIAAAGIQNGSVAIPLISETVDQYIALSTQKKKLYQQPSDLPSYQFNLKMMQRNRHLIMKEIRLRKLSRRKVWEELSDAYLSIRHKWDRHVLQIEKEEDDLAFREGPKLRGAVPSASSMRATTTAASSGNLLALGGATSAGGGGNDPLSSSSVALTRSAYSSAAAGAGGGGGGRISAMRGSGGANDPSSAGGTRSQSTNNYLGLNVARSDYEQERLLSEITAQELKQQRMERGASRIPDMISPWCGFADPSKLPRIPRWPDELRQFEILEETSNEEEDDDDEANDDDDEDVGEANDDNDDVDGAVADGEEGDDDGRSNKKRKLSAVSTNNNATPRKKKSKSASNESSKKSSKKKKNKSKKSSSLNPEVKEYQFNPMTFPRYRQDPYLIDFIDTSSLRFTTDGKKQLCANLPLNIPCPVECNCCLQVERYNSFTNMWTDVEKCIFVDKFLQYPKNFHKIASFLTNRTTKDCIKFYYDSKSTVEFKLLLKEFDNRRKQQGKINWNYSIKASHVIGSALYPVTAANSGSIGGGGVGNAAAGGGANNNNNDTINRRDSLVEIPTNDLTYLTFTLQPPHTGKTFNLPVANLYHKTHMEKNADGKVLILQNYPRDSTLRQSLRKKIDEFLTEEEEKQLLIQQQQALGGLLASSLKGGSRRQLVDAAATTSTTTTSAENAAVVAGVVDGEKKTPRRGRGRRPNNANNNTTNTEENNNLLASAYNDEDDDNNDSENEEYTAVDCKVEDILFDYEGLPEFMVPHPPPTMMDINHINYKPLLKDPFNKKYLYCYQKKFAENVYSSYRFTGGLDSRAFYYKDPTNGTEDVNEGLSQYQQQQYQQQQPATASTSQPAATTSAGGMKNQKHSASTNALQGMSTAGEKAPKSGGKGVRKTNSSNTLVEMMAATTSSTGGKGAAASKGNRSKASMKAPSPAPTTAKEETNPPAPVTTNNNNEADEKNKAEQLAPIPEEEEQPNKTVEEPEAEPETIAEEEMKEDDAMDQDNAVDNAEEFENNQDEMKDEEEEEEGEAPDVTVANDEADEESPPPPPPTDDDDQVSEEDEDATEPSVAADEDNQPPEEDALLPADMEEEGNDVADQAETNDEDDAPPPPPPDDEADDHDQKAALADEVPELNKIEQDNQDHQISEGDVVLEEPSTDAPKHEEEPAMDVDDFPLPAPPSPSIPQQLSSAEELNQAEGNDQMEIETEK